MSGSSIPEILRERASLQPNDTAFTFVDYEQDWDGVSASLTWAQLYRRTTNVARELSGIAKTGDRAVIVAPQGLEYLVAFLGSLEAGLIAVPLSIPMVGASDERVTAVLRDAAPTVVFTTSSDRRHRRPVRAAAPTVCPRPPCSRSTSSTWTPGTGPSVARSPGRKPPTCSTPRDRRGHLPASW